MSNRSKEPPSRSWLFDALIGVFVSATFGIILTIILYLAGDYRFPSGLRTLGSDLGMRIFAEPALQPDREFFKAEAPFVFLDVDYAACEKLKEDDQPKSICENPAKPPLQILTKLIDLASRSDPRVIILDYQLPDEAVKILDAERFRTFSETLRRDEGPIVIAPAPLRPTAKPQHLALTGEEGLDAIGRDGRLRLAAFVAWSDVNVGDGVVRDYPPLVFVDETTQANAIGFLPSAPFLAAMLAEKNEASSQHPSDLVDSLFYAAISECDANPDWLARWSERGGARLDELCKNGTFQLSDRRRERLMFSIHSLAATPSNDLENENAAELRAAYRGSGTVEGGMLYQHFVLSEFFQGDSADGWTNMEKALDLSSQIVVIGTSSIAGYDWHATPLGQMAGAEVIINATNAYTRFSNNNLSSPFSSWLTATLIQIFVAAVVATTLNALFNRFSPPEPERGKTSIASLLSSLVSFAFKTIGFLISFVISITLVAWITYRNFAKEPDTVMLDFLTPILSVFFVEIVVLSTMVLTFFTALYRKLFWPPYTKLLSIPKRNATNGEPEEGSE